MLISQKFRFSIAVSVLLILSPSFSGKPLASGSINRVFKENRKNSHTELSADAPKIRLNRKGVQFVNKYIRNSNECLVSVKKRSTVPFSIIDSVLSRYGLPVELKYLAVIESELKPSALSHVGARGPWQLMPATAQILGLHVSRHNDERTNYSKSTVAAAKYLRDLYGQFNDWLLVLAAYNGGPRPVLNAIKTSGSKNFWVLQEYLPAESRDHVKKFIATHYFFEGRGSETTLTRSELITYKKMVHLFVQSKSTPSRLSETKQACFALTRENTSPEYNLAGLVGFDYLGAALNNSGTGPQPGTDPHGPYTPETPAEKFRRLMLESGATLNRARKLI
jgi:hypothetical protein